MSVLGSLSADAPPEPKLESEPQWNAALEQVLRKEGEQAEALFWLHNQASVHATRYNDCIQIPAIVTATITGFLSATSDLVPPVGIGALSVVVGILGTIGSYFKFSQKAEGHRITSLWYMKTYKQIECQLALPTHQRQNAAELLRSLRDEMSRVSEVAPVLPEAVLKKFKDKFKTTETSVPIIANGLDRIYVWSEEPIQKVEAETQVEPQPEPQPKPEEPRRPAIKIRIVDPENRQ
jgi:hypothetical protein